MNQSELEKKVKRLPSAGKRMWASQDLFTSDWWIKLREISVQQIKGVAIQSWLNHVITLNNSRHSFENTR